MIGVSSEGRDILVGMIVQGHPTDLPSELSAQFPNGSTVKDTSQALVPVVLTAAAGTLPETIHLQLVVYQQQGPLNQPAAFVETVAPFAVNIGG
jgi:hypothetical protein